MLKVECVCWITATERDNGQYRLSCLCFLGVTEDAYIVPVSISYDKLVDGNFVNEQMVHNRILLSFSLVTKFKYTPWAVKDVPVNFAPWLLCFLVNFHTACYQWSQELILYRKLRADLFVKAQLSIFSCIDVIGDWTGVIMNNAT